MEKYKIPGLWVLSYLLIAYLIGEVTRANMGWYETLVKSPVNPPDIAFPIVWSTLYALLAIAGWKVWQRRSEKGMETIFMLYWSQMIINWGWSFAFFGAQQVTIGFWWILVLLLVMAALMVKACDKMRIVSFLVLPTFLWAGFAAYLNYSIMVLN